MNVEELQQQNDKLRSEVEAYRQRELAELRNQLAAAQEAAQHYRGEALRNADLARQIDANAQEHIARLKSEIELMHKSRNSVRRTDRGKP